MTVSYCDICKSSDFVKTIKICLDDNYPIIIKDFCDIHLKQFLGSDIVDRYNRVSKNIGGI